MPSLATYRKKRSFGKTREPRGRLAAGEGFSFVVQKHAARRLHYDFRLQLDGVLLSWAVPKGPSLDPKVKRLAVQTEDHPVEYGGFEGTIPQGEYGGGTVMIWDQGRWIPEGDARESYRNGVLKFRLEGKRLRGSWHLVRTKGTGKAGGDKPSWLLFKGSDDEASTTRDITQEDASVVSGRTMPAIARQADRGTPANPRAKDAPPDLATIAGARRASFPDAALPCQLARPTLKVPDGDSWFHEIKLDGYRILAHVEGDKVELFTRNGLDWTARFATLARALAKARLGQAVLDGEMVALDERGHSSFQALQNALAEDTRAAELAYFVFDLLYLDGWDLRGCRLDRRKELLRELLAVRASAAIRYSDHLVGNGPAAHAQACQLGLEGLVSKRRDATYRAGRGDAWLKAKCAARQELVVGGFSAPRGSRQHLGALLLGVYRKGELRYAGKVGTGFSEASLRELERKLAPLERKDPPFADPPRGVAARGVRWLEPTLVAEIAFAGFTDDGKVRQAVFHGLREDKPAKEVRPEPAQPVESVADAPAITHPERVLYPDVGITKGQLADYYRKVASAMLPHVANRPLTLVRCPDGQHRSCFYQKHLQRDRVPGLVPVSIRADGKTAQHFFLRDAAGLVGLAQLGVLEVHVWGALADEPEAPDRLVFDLDPAPDVAWPAVVEAAQEVRERMRRLGLESFVKSTGGKGLHVVVPLRRDGARFGWQPARAFCKAVAQAMAADSPRRYLAVATKAKRAGRIYVDHLRNARGATAVAAYSPRSRPGAPVSVPLAWNELAAFDPGAPYSVLNVAERLRRKDPWRELPDVQQGLGRDVLELVDAAKAGA